MKLVDLFEMFLFFIGFMIGVLINLNLNFNINKSLNIRKPLEIKSEEKFDLYDSTLADELHGNVRIFCIILTHPEQKSRAEHVRNTWAKKCTKFVFLSSEEGKDDTIALPYNESREILWGKVRDGFKYAYDNYFDEADWFLKGDHDS